MVTQGCLQLMSEKLYKSLEVINSTKKQQTEE